MPVQPGLALAVALVLLVAMAVAASAVGGLRRGQAIAVAALRAVVQLALVALVIAAVLSHLVWSLLFAALMFGVATVTSARRVEAPRRWPWVALAMAAGVLPCPAPSSGSCWGAAHRCEPVRRRCWCSPGCWPRRPPPWWWPIG